MEKIEITLYSYNELSDKAKERAVSENREKIGCSESSFVDDEFRSACDSLEENFGIKIRDIEAGGYSRFRVTGWFEEYQNESQYLPRYLEWLSNRLYKGKYYSTCMHRDDSGKYHYKHKYSKVVPGNYDCCLTGTYTDHAVDEAMRKRFEYVRKGYTIREFIDSVLDGFCKDWTRVLEDCFDTERIEEFLIENDCSFLKNGDMFVKERIV